MVPWSTGLLSAGSVVAGLAGWLADWVAGWLVGELVAGLPGWLGRRSYVLTYKSRDSDRTFSIVRFNMLTLRFR